MEFKDLMQRGLAIREGFKAYELEHTGASWSNEELALGFVGDVGDLAKLVMAANGRRVIPDAEQKLAHELADCLWSVIVLANVHGINLEQAFLHTMDDLERWTADQQARPTP
jgi:NTP pyrophosphatase (non-canonical NTP hydrolase)